MPKVRHSCPHGSGQAPKPPLPLSGVILTQDPQPRTPQLHSSAVARQAPCLGSKSGVAFGLPFRQCQELLLPLGAGLCPFTCTRMQCPNSGLSFRSSLPSCSPFPMSQLGLHHARFPLYEPSTEGGYDTCGAALRCGGGKAPGATTLGCTEQLQLQSNVSS